MNHEKCENRGLDQAIFNLVRDAYEGQTCHRTMGLSVAYLGTGIAGIKMIPAPQYSTGGGRVHGGMIATLMDVGMGAAAATLGHLYRTLEMSLNYLAPAYEEIELTAHGKVIHPGNTVAVVECSLFNEEGKLVAKSKGTYFRDNKITLPEK